MASVLIIGGTRFLGRAIAIEAVRRGHAVSAVNRGLSGPAPDGVESLRADRADAGQLARAVAGRHWDTVIDTCGFVPSEVGATAEVLRSHADHYIYVSAVDAMRAWPQEAVDETAAAWNCAADAGDEGGTYSVLKAGCERAVRSRFAGKVTVVRPGVIVGPWENIGRLPWWLRRLARGGPVLVPARDTPLQLIDSRDLAAFIVARHETPAADLYNAVGPSGPTLRGMIELCASDASPAAAELVEASDEFLRGHAVDPWWELPMWTPSWSRWYAACSVSDARATADGLSCRPLAATVRDTWAWLRERPEFKLRPKIGMSAEREQSLLAALSAETTL